MSNLHQINKEELETIEKYLDGSLPPEASLAFQKSLEDSEILRDTVSEYKNLFRDIEGAVLKDKLQVFHENMLQQNKEKSKKILLIKNRLHILRYAAAASVILIAAIAGIWFLNQTPENEKLFASYFTPDPGLITPMSSKTDYIFYDAMVNYKRGEYQRAIVKWEEILEQKQNNDTLNYFIGVSHLATGDAQTALPYLKKATLFPQSIFVQDASFYLGMAYLKVDNIPQAKKALHSSNLQKSKEVLNRLE
ncbi:MAG: hypothetical protein H0X63_03665 [Flavobacteriales bacterium]|nr:hypothetical protein [Flavobacteriales bacterium]